MNIALWIITGLLAAILLVSTSKAFVPREKMATTGEAAEWVLDFSPAALRTLALLDFLAAIGLVLPAILDIAPVMVPVTATCVAALFLGAAIMRLRRGERKTVAIDLVYCALAVFVAVCRFGPWAF